MKLFSHPQCLMRLARFTLEAHCSVVGRELDIAVKILSIGTDRSEQTVQNQIRLLLMEQSDQGYTVSYSIPPFLDAFWQCKTIPREYARGGHER